MSASKRASFESADSSLRTSSTRVSGCTAGVARVCRNAITRSTAAVMRSLHSPVTCPTDRLFLHRVASPGVGADHTASKSKTVTSGLTLNLTWIKCPTTTVDVQPPVATQLEFSGGVPLVLHRHHRRWQKGRPALSPVRVARKNPALERIPARKVDGIRVVAEHQRRLSCVDGRQDRRRLERVRPEIIEPDDLQAFDVGHPISQHGDALRLEDLDNPPSDFGVRPIRAVIVVTQDGQGREPALRKVAIDACGVFVDVVVVADEVAGHHDEIGSKLRRPLKRPSQVVVVHPGTDMNVAEVHERPAMEPRRQTRNGEWTSDELDPVGFHPPGIQSGRQCAQRSELKKPTTRYHSVPTRSCPFDP